MFRFGGAARPLVLGVGVLATGVMMPEEASAAVNVLPLGDSITHGTRSLSSGGYRQPLQQLLAHDGHSLHQNVEFIGGRDQGSGNLDDGTAMDDDHWGHPGAIPADSPRSNPYIGNGSLGTTPILNEDLNDQPTSVFEGGPANVVLIHTGTNTILGDEENHPKFGSGSSSYSANEAAGQLGNMLGTMQDIYQADAKRSTRRIAQDATILVADILPKAENSGVAGTTDADTVISTADFNSQIDSQIDSLGDTFESRFHRVDMFAISEDSVLRDALTSLGVSSSELNQLDPDDDGLVDWVMGSEANPFDETAPRAADYNGINTALLDSDQIHPTPLGYKVMASVWYEKMTSLGQVPEPASLTLVGLGLMVLGGRPRRRRATRALSDNR